MTDLELHRMSLEAFEHGVDHMSFLQREKAITALRERLAQPWEKFCDTHCTAFDHHPNCKLAQPEQEQWDAIPDAFNEWWNADYDDTGNPYRKDSPAYWAWSGWKAASKQPEQEPDIYPDEAFEMGLERIAYYAAPQPRQWQGLTDEERGEIEEIASSVGDAISMTHWKLREKNA